MLGLQGTMDVMRRKTGELRAAVIAALIALVMLGGGVLRAAEAEPTTEIPKTAKPEETSTRPAGLVHGILMYIPNRALDLIDIARLRLRVGPGFSAGARVTTVAAIGFGTHTSVFAGLPGPRQRPLPKLPVGIENYMGAEISLAKANVANLTGPDYSSTECGLSLHLLIIGLDLELDPLEMVDFVTGFIGIDARPDSL